MQEFLPNCPVWDDVSLPAQETLQGDVDADVCVIGLGGSGLAAVEECLALGKRVVGIDAGVIAGAAAGRNGGLLLAGLAKFYHETVAHIGRDRARKIYQRTIETIDAMCSASLESIRKIGSLRIIEEEDEREDCRAHLEALHRDEFEAESYNASQGYGIFFPTDAVFHPKEYCKMQAMRATAGGALLFEQTKAVDIEPHLVRTPLGNIHCEHSIVAVDGKLESLFPEALPDVHTFRLQMLATEAERHCLFPLPMYMRYGYDYLQQLPDGRIAIGGCRDFHATEECTMVDTYTDCVQRSIERILRQKGVCASVTHRWAASVGYTESGLPIAREVKQNVFAIGGYSGTGNVVGRLLGKGIARMIVTGDREIVDLLTKE